MVQKLNAIQSGLTSETVNQTPAFTAFGDSITAGVGTTGPAAYYVQRIADAKSWVLTNTGVSGAKVADSYVLDAVYAQTVTNAKNYTMMIGVNNAQNNGVAYNFLDTFRGCLMAEAIWLTIPEVYKIRTVNMAKTGTWVANPTVYNGLDMYSQTNGSTATGVVQGTTVYIGYTRTAATGTFSVVIDGKTYGSFATNEGGIPTRDVGGAFSAYALRFSGLKDGPHTVVITITSATGGSNNVYIDFMAGNGFKKEILGPNLWLANTTRSTDAYYSTHSPYTLASTELYNAAIREVHAALASDGLSVTFVDVTHAVDVATEMNADGIHPNDTGSQKLADAFVAQMSSIIKTRDRGGAQKTNTPWFDPVFQGNWVNFDADGTGFDNIGYMKDAMGFVHLRGIAKLTSGTINATNNMFYLPAGFRPSQDKHFICMSAGAAGTLEVYALSGRLVPSAGAATDFSLDGITFLAEQ